MKHEYIECTQSIVYFNFKNENGEVKIPFIERLVPMVGERMGLTAEELNNIIDQSRFLNKLLYK